VFVAHETLPDDEEYQEPCEEENDSQTAGLLLDRLRKRLEKYEKVNISYFLHNGGYLQRYAQDLMAVPDAVLDPRPLQRFADWLNDREKTRQEPLAGTPRHSPFHPVYYMLILLISFMTGHKAALVAKMTIIDHCLACHLLTPSQASALKKNDDVTVALLVCMM